MYDAYQKQVLIAFRTANVEALLQLFSQKTQQAFVSVLEVMLVALRNQSKVRSESYAHIEDLQKSLSEARKSNKQTTLPWLKTWSGSSVYRLHIICETVYRHVGQHSLLIIRRLKAMLITAKLSGFSFDTLLDIISFYTQEIKGSGHTVKDIKIVFDELIEAKFFVENDIHQFTDSIDKIILEMSQPRNALIIEALRELKKNVGGVSYTQRMEHVAAEY